MPTVVLRSTLRELAGAGEHRVDGATVNEALAALEALHPALAGLIRDEKGVVRRHVALFVNGERAAAAAPLAPTDRLSVLPAISGGADDVEILVGTKKGLIVLRGPRGGALEVDSRGFAGLPVYWASHDARSGTYFASVADEHFGPSLKRASDADGPWEPVEGLAFPDDVDGSLHRVWIIEPGERDGLVWAGAEPASLFRSDDGGRSFSFVRALWDVPERSLFQPGAGGLMVHSLSPWPGEPDRLALGISAGGMWLTDDGGASFRKGNVGLRAPYLPPDAKPVVEFCIHHVERSPSAPETLYMQMHHGVYRSDDGGESWTDIAAGLPSDFGFPLVADPRDGDRAWLVPLVADRDRVTPDGRLRVYETRDRGASWMAHGVGLPQADTYLTILRHAFCHDGRDPLGLYLGATSGELYSSADAGQTWQVAAAHLPPVLSVRIGA